MQRLGVTLIVMGAAVVALGGLSVPGAGGGSGVVRVAEAADGFNACGCRMTGGGTCTCQRGAKCGCPGECEPKGCEEKRAKQMEKEIQAETKKAEEAARRQQKGKSGDADERDTGVRGGKSEGTTSSAPAPAPAPAAKMTAAQKKDLVRLLGLYLAEHPEEADRSVEQVRAALAARPR